MKYTITKITSLNNFILLRLQKVRVIMFALFLISIVASLFAMKGWQYQSVSAQSASETKVETVTKQIPDRTNLVTASPGDLDLTFGVDGTAQIDFGYKLDDSAYAVVAVQPDNKVVAVGVSSTASTGQDFICCSD